MAYLVELSKAAKKDLKKIESEARIRIEKFILKLQEMVDPTLAGEPLKGTKNHLWRYRVGDYRLLCTIEKEILTIAVIRIGHRKDIYKK